MAYRGKSLKALRETKQIQLRRISNETRINMAYLEDLEEDLTQQDEILHELVDVEAELHPRQGMLTGYRLPG